MSAKHTPGPWLFHDAEEKIVTDLGTVIVWETGANAANIQLITAAPDLLEALKDVLRSCRRDFPAGAIGDSEFRKVYSEQFAAIAKATGAA